MTSAKAWGIDAELLTPDEVAKLVPFVDTDVVLGGFYTPSVSVVDSLRAGTIFRERAMASSARCRPSPASRCSAIEVDTGARHGGRHRPGPHRGRVRGHRVRRVEPADRGDGRRDDPAHARPCTR